MHDIFDLPPTNGNCRGQEVSTWFPAIERSMTTSKWIKFRETTKRALEICGTCSESKHCLEYSLRHEPFGIWGGKTESERAMLRAEKGINLSREGRVFIPGVGKRNANGYVFKGNPRLRDSVIKSSLDMDEAL